MRPGRNKEGGRAAALALILALQALATVFFIGDVAADLTFDAFDPHAALEALVALALFIGVLFGAFEMRRALERARRSEAALSVARGALAELIEARFEGWGLTPAEREVAYLALKGFDGAEIARLRGAAPGTVRAQLARVYAKAGVSSRAELLALFMDDLLDIPLAAPASKGAA